MSSGNSSDSFNIADTQYYKDALELSAGGFNESGKTLEVTNKNSDTITPIDASAAYAAGWKAAAAQFKRDGNYVYGPGESVSTNRYYKASVSITDTHKATASSYTIQSADVGSPAYGPPTLEGSSSASITWSS